MKQHMELPTFLSVIREHFEGTPVSGFIGEWENVIFSVLIGLILILVVHLGTRKMSMLPGRLQSFLEILAGGIDDFICGILGKEGRKYTPFIGTLFIYILSMNLFGLIPFMKSPTTSWSTTMALALCVFVFIQYTAVRKLSFKGYVDHLMGKPRGAMALSVLMPLMMLFLHLISEFIRPISLSLRLRSNIWGDDVLLALLTGFGFQGIPLVIFNMFLALIASTVQALVFTLLTTIYFSFILLDEEHA